MTSLNTSDAIARLFTAPGLEPAWFGDSFLATVPMEKVHAILTDVVATLGAYQSIDPNGSSYTVTFSRGTIQVEASVDADGVFTGLSVGRMQCKMAEERLTGLLQASEVHAAWFSDLYLAAVPLDQVSAIINDLKAQSGAFRSVFAAQDGTYDIALAKGRYSARIYLGRDGKILGLNFLPR